MLRQVLKRAATASSASTQSIVRCPIGARTMSYMEARVGSTDEEERSVRTKKWGTTQETSRLIVDEFQAGTHTLLAGSQVVQGDASEFYKTRPSLYQTTAHKEEMQKLSRVDEFISELTLSTDYEDAKRKSRALYRRILRRLPTILLTYELQEVPPMDAIRSVRSYFMKHAGVTDPAVIDHLRWMGEVMLADIVRCYFTYSHVHNLVFPKQEYLPPLPETASPSVVKPETPFLEEFFSQDTPSIRRAKAQSQGFIQPPRV